ncbi:LysM peptidoglycan-binding domain-containing protein [Desulfobotulus sp. H1]|uniref:LysM peptidoglycan-binding domain-containing protein n=1 Tax=Desulfobotulus pelophilus TaxID=2823377 RepID=A0ABT3N4N2_9BACT|nr:LysM peptidoglycan-binding domain-containing protein [Desulfobotulus pelophilus]MCW7752422.1 LysM peptidoglycan-binding domain-containing protein [Desulfobotulus pelophilus]
MKRLFLCFFCSSLLFYSGCASLQNPTASNSKTTPPESALADEDKISSPGKAQSTPAATPASRRKTPVVIAEKTITSPFDQALDFYDTANEFWMAGEYDSALESLDQAYDLIMRAETLTPTDLQQRDDIRLTIARRILEVYSSRTIGVEGKQSAIQIPDNVYVQREIDRFTGQERLFFERAYRRSGIYMDMILEKLNEAGLPEELAWLPLIESGFQVKALSSARALGLWQFIPSTGVRFGLKRDLLIDERMDPEKATDAAVAYLTELHRLFGDWPTVLAAYNCGEGRVLRTIRSQNVNYLDNFWDLYTKLPRETAQYVPRFLATIHILQNMEKYGFDPNQLDAPPAYENVSVERQVTLQSIASVTGIALKDLKELNPELRYDLLPNETYTLKIPQGYTDRFLASIESIEEATPPQRAYLHHRVKPGEALSTIAARYKVSVRQLMTENGIQRANLIRAGQVIKIPSGSSSQTVAASPGRNIAPSSAQERQTLSYTVQKGDTLWDISRRFNISTQNIIAANQLPHTRLQIGQRLRIPGGAQQVKNLDTQRQAYRVQAGDTPFTIALKHNMPLQRLLQINNLSRQSTIYPGQQLFIE